MTAAILLPMTDYSPQQIGTPRGRSMIEHPGILITNWPVSLRRACILVNARYDSFAILFYFIK
jgi:hypothetical protein